MTLKLHLPDSTDLKPRLTVFGVGGAGGNAVNNMIARSLEGVEFVVANTDAQALSLSDAVHKIQLGENLTEGLGAGAKPEIGALAAEESLEQISDLLLGSHMCFITAGMGGGTGTGAAPIIAQTARQLGILTVGVVTKPFHFEGGRRMNQADDGIKELQEYVDTLIVIPNQNLFRLANENTSFTDAFGMADDVLYQGVKGVTDLMVRPGHVNLDFADIRSVMDEMGKAMMGTGEAEGEDRAIIAAERAIANPLLDEISLQGARGVLINITGGEDMSLYEVDEASNKIREEVDQDANIIFGTTMDPEINGFIRVSVVATGIDVEEDAKAQPNRRQRTENVAVEAEKPSDPDLFSQEVPVIEQTAPLDGIEHRLSETDQVLAEQMEPTIEASTYAQSDDFTGVANSSGQNVEMDVQTSDPEMAQAQQVAAAPSTDHINDEPQEAVPLRERVRAAVNKIPTTAPSANETNSAESEHIAGGEHRKDTQRVKYNIADTIKKMSGVERGAEETPVASRSPEHQPERHGAPRTPVQAPRPRMNEEEQQRVDIPAFLRRQAN